MTGGWIRCILAISFWFVFAAAGSGPEETAKQVVTAIRAGNAEHVAKHFSNMVGLTLPGFDDTYSKSQAGQILKDFFSRNPVKDFRVTRQGASEDGSHYSIGELKSGAKTYRVYFLIRKIDGRTVVQQLQIREAE
jgi:hypothetical protein